MPLDKVNVLVGPTAVGKTSLSLEIAERRAVEVISADSMQIYRGMDIGTAKPSREIMRRIPHHMIDIVDPDESFNAARFQKEADRAVEQIVGRGKTPLIVGGTGLYVKAFLHGLFPGEGEMQGGKAYKKSYEYSRLGSNPHAVLSVVDPEAASRIHPHDVMRAQRALEVFYRTGERISALQSRHGFAEQRYDALVISLTADRETLYGRINTRVDAMMAAGLLKEVQSLLDMGYSEDLPSMGGLGYRHMIQVIRGHSDLTEAVRLLKRDTRRYAKRQITWFGKQKRAAVYRQDAEETLILYAIQEFLQGR